MPRCPPPKSHTHTHTQPQRVVCARQQRRAGSLCEVRPGVDLAPRVVVRSYHHVVCTLAPLEPGRRRQSCLHTHSAAQPVIWFVRRQLRLRGRSHAAVAAARAVPAEHVQLTACACIVSTSGQTVTARRSNHEGVACVRLWSSWRSWASASAWAATCHGHMGAHTSMESSSCSLHTAPTQHFSHVDDHPRSRPQMGRAPMAACASGSVPSLLSTPPTPARRPH